MFLLKSKMILDVCFKIRWFLGVGFFVILVALKIHGVSLLSWNGIVKDITNDYSYPTIGKDRGIRSDEYAVSVPLVKSQCDNTNFFPRINKQCNGTGMNMFVTTPPCPVWDWTVIGQAQNWGYFLLGFDRGLSWNWFIRYLMGFLFALEFFLIWLKGDRPLSITGAIAVTLGSSTQWWTTTIPYLNVFFFASLVFLYKLFTWRNLGLQLVAGVALLVSLCSFGFSFYPPFQFLYAICMILLGVDIVWCARRQRTSHRAAWVILLFVVLLCTIEWFYFFAVNSETLANIRSSAYPGARVFTGGAIRNLTELQFWKHICLFTPLKDATFLNNCEISLFYVPTIALVTVSFKWRRQIREQSPVYFTLMAWAAIMFLWVGIQWPVWLAKITSFSRLHIARVAVTATFLTLLMAFKAFSCLPKRGNTSRTIIYTVMSFVIIISAVSLFWTPRLLTYFTSAGILKGSAALCAALALFVMLSFAMLTSNRNIFIGGYLIVSLLSGLLVNP